MSNEIDWTKMTWWGAPIEEHPSKPKGKLKPLVLTLPRTHRPGDRRRKIRVWVEEHPYID